MDVQGISGAGKDIAHATACHVLGDIPCGENGQVQGVGDVNKDMRNQRSGDPNLTPQQLDDMERLLQQRDCAYREQFLQYQELGVLGIHFGDTIWDGCDPNKQSNRDLFVNTTLLFELLQRQVGCGKNSTGPTIGDLKKESLSKADLHFFLSGPLAFVVMFFFALYFCKGTHRRMQGRKENKLT